MILENDDTKLTSPLTGDPIRIIEAINAGVSFLGAGYHHAQQSGIAGAPASPAEERL